MGSITYLGGRAGWTPWEPEANGRPVNAPNSAVGAALPVAVKSTVSQAGLASPAFKAHRPTLCADVPQFAKNLAISVLPLAKMELRFEDEVAGKPSISNSASIKAASAACHATCISRSLRVPRSPIIASCTPPTPKMETITKMSNTTIRENPLCRCRKPLCSIGTWLMEFISKTLQILEIAQMHRKGNDLPHASIRGRRKHSSRVRCG